MSSVRRNSYSQNVGRRTSTDTQNCNNSNRSDFLRNQGQPSRNYPFTQTSENRWSLGGPETNQQQKPSNIYYNNRPSSTSLRDQVRPTASNQNAGLVQAMSQMSMSPPQGDNAATAIPGAALPDDLAGNPNVKYVRLNWEDILGGKDGMKGMKVAMAPPAQGGDSNQNRQLRISFGNQGGEAGSDGSIPLKVLSFDPVENYPGQMTGGSASAQAMSQASGLSQRPATPMPRQQTQSARHQSSGYSRMSETAGKPRMSQTSMRQQQHPLRQTGSRTGMGMTGTNTACGSCAACQFRQPNRNILKY